MQPNQQRAATPGRHHNCEMPLRELVNPHYAQLPARSRHHPRSPTSQAELGLKERRLQGGYDASGSAVTRLGTGQDFRLEKPDTVVGGARR